MAGTHRSRSHPRPHHPFITHRPYAPSLAPSPSPSLHHTFTATPSLLSHPRPHHPFTVTHTFTINLTSPSLSPLISLAASLSPLHSLSCPPRPHHHLTLSLSLSLLSGTWSARRKRSSRSVITSSYTPGVLSYGQLLLIKFMGGHH